MWSASLFKYTVFCTQIVMSFSMLSLPSAGTGCFQVLPIAVPAKNPPCQSYMRILSRVVGCLAAFLWALSAAWMTLSAAALAIDIIALSFVKTTSSSIWIMALFHAVAMLLLTLSKVSAMRRKVMRLSLSSSLVGGWWDTRLKRSRA